MGTPAPHHDGSTTGTAVHRYRAQVTWSGSTGAGYEAYDRTHAVTCPPATADLTVSSDPAFRGDPTLLDPEQLLLAAASSCQLLAFLAVAARARVDVVTYTDQAEAVMPEDDPPVRITAIALRPRIIVRGPGGATAVDKLARLVEVAHHECFIANSLRSDVVVEPVIVFAGD
ncbi:MAG: OsmC family protein [Acidimicrobiales bacterium]